MHVTKNPPAALTAAGLGLLVAPTNTAPKGAARRYRVRAAVGYTELRVSQGPICTVHTETDMNIYIYIYRHEYIHL